MAEQKEDREHTKKGTETQECIPQRSYLNILSYQFAEEGSDDDPEYNPDDEQPEETEEDDHEEEEEEDNDLSVTIPTTQTVTTQAISRTGSNDIEMRSSQLQQTAIPNTKTIRMSDTNGPSIASNLNAFNASSADLTVTAVPILNAARGANGGNEEDENEDSSSSTNDASTSDVNHVETEEDDENEEEDDDDDEDDDVDHDDNEYPDVNILCLPEPFNTMLARYLREGIFFNASHRDNAFKLFQRLEQFKNKYESDKSKHSITSGENVELKWEIWYASYWPKTNNNYSSSSSSNNNNNVDEIMNDLLHLEAFRYQLHEIGAQFTNYTQLDHSSYSNCSARLQYLVTYGLLSIQKIQEHYRYISGRNLCLSWSVVVWLTSAVDFCAQYMYYDLLTPLCVPLLKSAFTCFDYILNTIRRNHHSQSSMYNSFETSACKLAKKFIENACKFEYEFIKQKHMNRHHKKLWKPRFDTFMLYVLIRDPDRDILKQFRIMMNALNVTYNEWKIQQSPSVAMDNKENIETSSLSSLVFKLSFPWDSAQHLAQFLYICEKCAFYLSEYLNIHTKWIEKIIDGFYKNIINFPTEHIRVLNDVDPIYYQNNYNRGYVPNSLTHIMTIFNKLISCIHEDNVVDYEYIGEEFDVLHDGHRMIDISFLSIYMKQIGNSNVEIQLRGLTKIHEIMRKIQQRCTRRYNNSDSPYDDNSSCGNNNNSNNNNNHNNNNNSGNNSKQYYQYNGLIEHKWLSEPRLAQYLTEKEFINKLFERDSHNKILERSQSIIQFLAEQAQINQKDLQLIWMRCQHKHESQIDAYYKIIKTLALSLDEDNIKYLLQIITKTPRHEWDTDYVNLIYTITRFAAEKRFKRNNLRQQQQNNDNNNNNTNNNTNNTTTNNANVIKPETYWFGLQELWDISMDDLHSVLLQQQARNFVADLLSLQCFVSQIEMYLMRCVRLLHDNQHIVQAMRFFKTISIRHIWGNQYMKTGLEQQHNAETLKYIAKKYNLLSLIFDGLRRDFSLRYAQNNDISSVTQLQSVIETQFSIGAKSESLQQRLIFIDFLLRFADGKISQNEVKELWHMIVCNPCLSPSLKGHGLDYFCNAIDPQKQEIHFRNAACTQNVSNQVLNAAFTDEISHYVGKHLCNTLDPKLMTIKHFNLSKAYFYHIGVADRIFRVKGAYYYLIDANRLDIDWLWKIVFDAIECNVSSEAQLLLKDVYTLIDFGHDHDANNVDVSSLYESFIDKCMTCAQNATRPPTPTTKEDVIMNPSASAAPNTNGINGINGIQQVLSCLLNRNSSVSKEEMNRITIKRCFSLLRMAIDHFGGKRHGNSMQIELNFVEISSTDTQLRKSNKQIIKIGELQTCRELAVRVKQEVRKKCAKGKGFTLKGIIKSGKRIDNESTSLADEFIFDHEKKEVNVVYTVYDIACATEEKTNALTVPTLPQIKPQIELAPTISFTSPNFGSETTQFPSVVDDKKLKRGILSSAAETPESNASDTVDVDVEAMSNDPVIIQQQKELESSIRSNSCGNSIDTEERERGVSPPPPPPPPSVTNQQTQYQTTPRPTRKQPRFGNAAANKTNPNMKQLTLTSMYKEGNKNTMIMKRNDYNDFTTGGLTRVDSMLSMAAVDNTVYAALHPSDILSKSKYFNQLFSFLTYSHDIACEAWEILRKLPLNREKKLCVKDFGDGWNHMFDLKQHHSVLMARYGLDILSKLTRNDAKIYKERNGKNMKNGNDVAMLDCVAKDAQPSAQRWIIQFIRKHGLLLVLQLLISIDINMNECTNSLNKPPPEISCASMIIHFLADILQIDNEPNSIANEILSDKETAQLFLSPKVLSSIMKIIGVLSSFTESASLDNKHMHKPIAAMIGPQLPAYLRGNCNNINPMKLSTEVLQLCFIVLKFILQNDKSHQLIEYFLSSNLRQWIYRLLIHSQYAELRLMVKCQLQLLYQDHFEMGHSDLLTLDKMKDRSQDPRLLVGIVKACLEILGILAVADTQFTHVALEYEDRFRCNEFMDFLHDAIRDLVHSFDVLSKYPQYQTLLIENCSNYNGINWCDLLDKFMSYFISYPVTESQQTRPDDTKLLPVTTKAAAYRANMSADTVNDEHHADKCLIGVMNIISKLIETLSNNDIKITANKNINNTLITFIETVFHRGLFPDIDSIWKQRRDPLQLPLCKQKLTRQTCMKLLINIATFCDCKILCRIREMMAAHHSSLHRLRKHFSFSVENDWNYLDNILSRPFNGYVGLVNLGATCYMNSLMQQLFSNQQFRFSVLSRDVKAIRQRHMDEKQKLIDAKRDELKLHKTDSNHSITLKEEKEDKEYKDEDIWKMIVDNNNNNNNKMIVIGDKDDENCDMLNELQNIFTYLQESDLRCYDPVSFCTAYKQPGGRMMELRVQMDVDEFFAVFTDKLEKQLQFDAHCNIIQYLFGGVFATQMIGRKGCKHYREKSDPFVTLTLDVKSKKDIMNSLNSYVQGEVITDYQCDKCMKRIEILKRSCIRILPRNLVIHLKRFDFDIETLGRAKVNDSLEFPAYLDMTPFTKDGLENKEQKQYIVEDSDLTEEEKKDRDMNEKKFNETYDFESSNMYRLVGIINHSGGTESGHYTSYIRQRQCDDNNGAAAELNHKWSYFNDRMVEQWDCKKIPDDCFGGPLTSFSSSTKTNNNNNSNNNTNNTPSNKMYSAYMLFYERVSLEQRQVIESKMQNGALSKSYYNLTDVLMNNIKNKKKVSGRKRPHTECAHDYQPPHKKQKLSNGRSSIVATDEIETLETFTTYTSIRREDLMDSDPKAIPKYVSKEEQCNVLDAEKRERVWNENKAAIIERQVLERQYIETCIKTALLFAPKDADDDPKLDANQELFKASKLSLTLLFETISHCKNLNQIIQRKERNQMCKILSKSPLGCKWFLMKLKAIHDNHWLRTLYDPKLNRIYGETIGDIARDLVITALKCVRAEEHKYYKQALKAIDYDMYDMDIDLDIDTSSHCIVALIRLMMQQFPLMDKAEYSHPLFDILMHFAHFGNEERVLLIDLGMIWKGIAYYRRDFNGLRSGTPTKNSERNNPSSASSSSSSSANEVKLGWKRKALKDVAALKALPQIISTLITSIHPEYLETFFHEQHYNDTKKVEKAVAEDWLHSKCLLPDKEAHKVVQEADEEEEEKENPPNLPPKVGPQPLQSSMPKLEKVVMSPFPNKNYSRFAIAPNVQNECHLSKNDYLWLKNRDVLEYLLEYGTVTHLSEVTMSHLAHSSNILYKRIINKMAESFNTVFQSTLKHLFDVIKLILGLFDENNTKYTLTTMPEPELVTRCIHKIYPKLFTCATSQEAKYHKDAQALMEFAKELTTSPDYCFALEVATQPDMMLLIIKNLFDKNKALVRHLSMVILKHIIRVIEQKQQLSKREMMINAIIDQLPNAHSIASNQSLIDNSNESFPDDLKNYAERKPKVNKYFAVLELLMQLYPEIVVPSITEEDNWNTICKTVAALESGSDTFSWAKNDDKLIVMQIVVDCIDKYHVDASKLFNTQLVDALTSQYLVSTRSKVVSTHMAQVVSITYRLLTHFAFQNEIGAKWICDKIVDKHWFLWAISDIVTPHNVYQNSLAADSILVFIEKVIHLDCMKSARTKIIEKSLKKWDSSASHSTSNKKLAQYPRQTILKLLMLVLITEQDHINFLQHSHGRKLIQQWIHNFFLSNILNADEELATYNVAFDFFTFHIERITEYVSLQTNVCVSVLMMYAEAICSVFAYYSNMKTRNEWNHCLTRAQNVLESIFDLQKIYKAPHDDEILKQFLGKLSRSEILMFSSNPKDYIRTANSTDAEESVIKYLSFVVDACKHPQSIKQLIKRKIEFIEAKKNMHSYQLSVLFEIFCTNCANKEGDNKFDWNNDRFDIQMQKNIAAVMFSCWFLQLMGCKLTDCIEENVSIYLNKIVQNSHKHEAFIVQPVCWLNFIALITSGSLSYEMLCKPMHMNIIVFLTKATLDSILDDSNSHKLLKEAKRKTLLQYLPYRLLFCIENINEMNQTQECLSHCLAFIQYYHKVLSYKSVIIYLKYTTMHKLWIEIKKKMDEIINRKELIINDETMLQIIEYLQKMTEIVSTVFEAHNKEKEDVVMTSNEKPKSLLMNKKNVKSFKIKLNPNKKQTQEEDKETMTVDTNDNDANDANNANDANDANGK